MLFLSFILFCWKFWHPSICTAINSYCQWLNPTLFHSSMRSVYTWELAHKNHFCISGKRGSKWTKINSSKGFNHYLIFCVVNRMQHFPVPNQKLFVMRRGEGRNYCNCSTDYLYPGYGSQPPIRSHDLTIIYTHYTVCPSAMTMVAFRHVYILYFCNWNR